MGSIWLRGVCSSIAALAVAIPMPSAAWSSDQVSAWSEGFNNKARLHIGAVAPDTAGDPSRNAAAPLYAGLEIVMPVGWKTYWRTPGDAGGIPPEFDWSGSENLSAARVVFPAPHQLVDKSGTTYGYKDRVLFPISITPKVATEPVVLKLAASYGVCQDICIPAEAAFTITVPPSIAPSADIAVALATVPRPVTDEATDPVLTTWSITKDAAKSTLVLQVDDPANDTTQVFVEATAGAFVPVPVRLDARGAERDTAKSGRSIHHVELGTGAELAALSAKPLTVTLVGAKGQSEFSISLEKPTE